MLLRWVLACLGHAGAEGGPGERLPVLATAGRVQRVQQQGASHARLLGAVACRSRQRMLLIPPIPAIMMSPLRLWWPGEGGGGWPWAIVTAALA